MNRTTAIWRVAAPATLSALLTLTILAVFASSVEAADPYYTFNGCRYDPDTMTPITYRFYAMGDKIREGVRRRGVRMGCNFGSRLLRENVGFNTSNLRVRRRLPGGGLARRYER